MPEGLIWTLGIGCTAYTAFELFRLCVLSTRPRARAWDQNERELHVEEIK